MIITIGTGGTVVTRYERALARLVHHEIDHLDGLLDLARIRRRAAGQTGRAWSYEA